MKTLSMCCTGQAVGPRDVQLECLTRAHNLFDVSFSSMLESCMGILNASVEVLILLVHDLIQTIIAGQRGTYPEGLGFV